MSVASAETSDNLSPELVEQAAHWYALMQSGDISVDDEHAFYAWRLIAENAAAYQRIVDMWEQVDAVEADSARRTVEAVLSDQRRVKKKSSRRVVGGVASVLVLIVGLLFGVQTMPVDNFLAGHLLSGRLFSDYSTAIGEQQLVILDDQTRVYLNTFSAINVEYTQNQRTIYLLQGEIQLDVAKDVKRPLVVLSDQGSARALGTQFVVRNRGEVTDVSVTESRVEVCLPNKQVSAEFVTNRGTAPQCQQLKAGEKAQIDQYQVQSPQVINANFTRDWIRKLLIVDNQSVLDVLDELSRYQTGYIRIDRRALAEYTVSGVFPLDDVEKSLQVLEGSLPITVSSYTPLITVVKLR